MTHIVIKLDHEPMKRNIDQFTQSYLQSRLSYNPETGVLTWKRRTDVGARVASWNSKWAGKPAINSLDKAGYRRGRVGGVMVKAHQVIWKLVTGESADQIDHINGKPSDNRISNLRAVDQFENQKNGRQRVKKSGLPKGVTKNGNRFTARIRNGGKQEYLGTFDTPEEARAVYAAEARRLGFTDRHIAQTIRQLEKECGK